MSKLSDDVYALLKECFPHNVILSEHYVKFKNERLFFDYYIKDLGILVECQGRQHENYIEHFHGDAEGFRAAKKRDHLKKEYCEKKGFVFIDIHEGEKLSKEVLFSRMLAKTIKNVSINVRTLE